MLAAGVHGGEEARLGLESNSQARRWWREGKSLGLAAFLVISVPATSVKRVVMMRNR
ncbi:hypothetical protein BU23DRAFT_53928 [Bimuria novae-zelandiae CBS 107.79]|uniref:Uncharacterized protein n=1 Tax=Bimuria novae-zelandiae CBS 107.79 TaxID=1447943 RepID=A0A6A5UIP0_9PLEO|nr:hypothetical protein BU23DRAFT_53928 [Bimuria novae-zelandiae CBS 107.79]